MSETDLFKKREALIKSSPAMQFVLLGIETSCENPPYEKVQALRKILADTPDLWRDLGDLARSATERLIDGANRYDKAKSESVKCGAEHLKIELGYLAASAIERLAIEQVVLCWAEFYNVQESYTRARYDGDNVTMSTFEFQDKPLTLAQQRYFRAMEWLARIRKLSKGIDVVQVNITAEGGQQINMAMSTSAG